jgi:hypothetical protein
MNEIHQALWQQKSANGVDDAAHLLEQYKVDGHPAECCSPTATVVNSSFNVHL